MAGIVKDLPTIVATSSGKTIGIGHLDDAGSITIFLASSATGAIPLVQISQFDPADPTPGGVTQSSAWITAPFTFTSSLTALQLTNISFRGFRLNSTSTAFTANEIVGFASKQISV